MCFHRRLILYRYKTTENYDEPCYNVHQSGRYFHWATAEFDVTPHHDVDNINRIQYNNMIYIVHHAKPLIIHRW